MNITNCVKCGGKVRSESIGWICENCKGFIDVDGNYHPHVEKPFVPPMTNGDRIRAMTDEELALWVDKWCRASENCIICPLDFCPSDRGLSWLDWLKQPAKEEA
jgi:hypothetical protein